ncbi:MAG: MBL fold metallo-hydrolase [Bacteroidota bacterium]|nr:MBL fold metallo-hydrolase [Bacteroidota bacterium]
MFHIQVLTFNAVQENTYVLFNENKDCILIDPGCYDREEEEELRKFIDHHELHPRLLLNTHCHLDHVFGNRWVAETYGLTLHLHPDEKPLLDMAPASGLMFNLPFDNYAGELIFLKQGDKVTLGEDELTVIEAPGHSPGSICFYCEKQQFLIGGDVVFENSIGRTDLPGGSLETLLDNIRKKILTLPEAVVIYPGHGPSTTVGKEKQFNPFLQ